MVYWKARTVWHNAQCVSNGRENDGGKNANANNTEQYTIIWLFIVVVVGYCLSAVSRATSKTVLCRASVDAPVPLRHHTTRHRFERRVHEQWRGRRRTKRKPLQFRNNNATIIILLTARNTGRQIAIKIIICHDVYGSPNAYLRMLRRADPPLPSTSSSEKIATRCAKNETNDRNCVVYRKSLFPHDRTFCRDFVQW